jgi:hypothetical protein
MPPLRGASPAIRVHRDDQHRSPVADKFKRFYNFLAKMGLVIRDDPPKVIDMTGREWGEAAEGLALSIRELKREDPGQVAGISIVMKNGGTNPKTFQVPPWIFSYKVDGVDLSPYGRQLMSSDQKVKNIEVSLGPGDAIESDLPVATLYNMRAAGSYKIGVSCRLPDETILRSNEIVIRV